MGRPKKVHMAARSRSRNIRLHLAEDEGLKQLAERLGQTPSRLIRRLIREALTGGPDYFEDGVLEIITMHRELAAIGRNLNQLVRTANRGGRISGDDVRGVLNAGIVQMEAAKGLYLRAVKATLGRAVLPLYAEAGVPLPQGEAGNAQPAPAPTE